MAKAIFYHAGCEVCLSAEQMLAEAIDPRKYELEIVHFGNAPDRIDEAEKAGVRSVPALLLNGTAFHINHGASMAEVKQVVAV